MSPASWFPLIFPTNQKGCSNVVEFLSGSELDSDPTISNAEGRSALQLAALWGHWSCADALLSVVGVSHLSHGDNWGLTALHLAALNGHAKVEEKVYSSHR